MQRCQSIITMPSSRFQVACVGQTRTQGGLSQWLQSTITGAARSGGVLVLLAGEDVLEGLLPDPADFVAAHRGMDGTLWTWWQAAMHLVQFSCFQAPGHIDGHAPAHAGDGAERSSGRAGQKREAARCAGRCAGR